MCGLSADAANTYRGRVSGILVVDDDRTVGEVLLKYLQRFKPAEEGGLPVIPDSYRNPVKSLVPVNRPK